MMWKGNASHLEPARYSLATVLYGPQSVTEASAAPATSTIDAIHIPKIKVGFDDHCRYN
jgi:hypothetical protein